jgi:hypothetical protein
MYREEREFWDEFPLLLETLARRKWVWSPELEAYADTSQTVTQGLVPTDRITWGTWSFPAARSHCITV